MKECSGLDTKDFKFKLATDLNRKLSPIREKYDALMGDQGTIVEILKDGAEKAQQVAQKTMKDVRELIGFSL